MSKEYSNRLESIKARRFDQENDQPILRDGFFNPDYPDVLKYALESMKAIDPRASARVFTNIKRTQDLIQQKLIQRDIHTDARYIGPHATATHIELYGDLQMLMVLRSFEGKASQAVSLLTGEIMDILEKAQAYNSVDNTDRQSIKVKLRKPICMISIIPAIWISSSLYKKSNIEINRGICEFDYGQKTRKVHLPFLNMARMNAQDKLVNGNLSAIVRLLRTLRFDSEQKIDLTDDEIIGAVFNFSLNELKVPNGKLLSLLPNVSLELGRLISDANYRESLVSPGRREYVFGKRDKAGALATLQKEVDELISDLERELRPINKTLVSEIEY